MAKVIINRTVTLTDSPADASGRQVARFDGCPFGHFKVILRHEDPDGIYRDRMCEAKERSADVTR